MKVYLPEQVSVELKTASFGTRALAYSLDFCIRWTFTILFLAALLIGFGMLQGIVAVSVWINWVFEKFKDITALDSVFTLGISMTLFSIFVIQWSYSLYFEVLREGLSPGKQLMGLRVVDEQGLPLNFRASFLRTVFLLVDLLPAFGFVGMASMLLTRRSQRLGDIVAGTMVVREEAPPAVRGVSHEFLLPFEHYALLERFIARAPELTPKARERIGRELRPAVERFIANPPEGDDYTWLRWVLERSYPEKRA